MIEAFNQHRAQLFGIAYRMLGRIAEAEDLLQEVWLRWQRQDPAQVTSPKAWLVATTTRMCIDQLRLARREREEYYGVWLPEPLMTGSSDAPDRAASMADSLSMAFMLLLETLDPVERAAFLLREVFGYEYAEAAAIVGKSEVNCRQIVRRAKVQLDAQPKSAHPPDAQAQQLVEEFLAAAESGNVQELLAMLTEDAVVLSDGGGKVKAAGNPIVSADRVSRFFVGVLSKLPRDTIWVPAEINGRLGLLLRTGGEVFGVCSFELHGGKFHRFYMVLNPEKLRHVGRA